MQFITKWLSFVAIFKFDNKILKTIKMRFEMNKGALKFEWKLDSFF